MGTLLALAPVGTWGLQEWIIFIVIITAAIGVAYLVMTRVFGVVPPAWLVQILWICLAAFVAVMAIRFLFTL